MNGRCRALTEAKSKVRSVEDPIALLLRHRYRTGTVSVPAVRSRFSKSISTLLQHPTPPNSNFFPRNTSASQTGICPLFGLYHPWEKLQNFGLAELESKMLRATIAGVEFTCCLCGSPWDALLLRPSSTVINLKTTRLFGSCVRRSRAIRTARNAPQTLLQSSQ
jgi:hypothetical protein